MLNLGALGALAVKNFGLGLTLDHLEPSTTTGSNSVGSLDAGFMPTKEYTPPPFTPIPTFPHSGGRGDP